MLKEHPLHHALGSGAERGIGGFDRHHLQAGRKGGGGAKLGLAVANEIGQADAAIARAIPRERGAANILGPLAAIGGLPIPEGHTGIVISPAQGGEPRTIGGGLGEFPHPEFCVAGLVVHQAVFKPGMRNMVLPVPPHFTTHCGKLRLNQRMKSLSRQQPGTFQFQK